MALIPKTTYPGQIDESDAAYPHGKAQNITVSGDGTGTPWEKDLVNDLFGFQQALLDQAGLAPDGAPDEVGASQYLDAIRTVIEDDVGARVTDLETDSAALLSHVRPDLTERTIFVGAKAGTPDWDVANVRPEWRPDSTSLGARDVMKCFAALGRISWDLRPGAELPADCTVTRVRCWVKPAGAYGAGDEMVLSVYRIDDAIAAQVAGGGVSTTSSTSLHAISTGTISVGLVAANTDVYPPGSNLGLSVVLTGGNGADDLAYFLEVRYTRTVI